MSGELDFFIYLGFGFVILLIFAFLYVKDTETTKKLRRYEKSIEDLNKQVYKLTKQLKARELESDLPGAAEASVALKQEMQDDLDRSCGEIYRNIETLDGNFKQYRHEMEEKIALLEERVKESTLLPSTATSIDEGKIIQMFQSGWSIDHIAKELRIGKGEVEFTLKLANIK